MNTSRHKVGRYVVLGLALGIVAAIVFWVLFQPLRGANTQKPPLGSVTVTQTMTPTTGVTTPVVSRMFNRYTIQLPPGTTIVSSQTGKGGEVRTTYKTPAGEQIMTIAFSANFRWRDYSEELTTKCPSATEGPQTPINWGGSYKGGYTAWDRSGCGQGPLVTFTTFSEVENVAVVQLRVAKPAPWLVKAVEKAGWKE